MTTSFLGLGSLGKNDGRGQGGSQESFLPLFAVTARLRREIPSRWVLRRKKPHHDELWFGPLQFILPTFDVLSELKWSRKVLKKNEDYF